MPADPALIERSGDLKQELVAYIERGALRRELDSARRERFGTSRRIDEGDFINFLDWFLLQHRLPDGRTVIEQFVADHPRLPGKERQMLLGWRDVVEGIFRVEEQEGEALLAVNLVDELTYRIRSNMGPRAIASLKPGDFLITRIVPVQDEWLLSGATHRLPASSRTHVLRQAAALALRSPSLCFRNPKKLQEAWDVQRADREEFIAFFGSDTVVVPGERLPETMRAYAHYKVYEARDAEGRTAAERSQEAYGRDPPLPVPDFPQEMLAAKTIGIIYDEVEGMHFFTDFGTLEEAFAEPELAARDPHRAAVLAYFQDPDLHPLPLRRLAAHDLQNADRVFRAALPARPRFSWQRDGEALMRQYKPQYYERPSLPSVAPISRELSESQLSARIEPTTRESTPRPSRNQPCPCGSGKKYKLCCGR